MKKAALGRLLLLEATGFAEESLTPEPPMPP
jgi:hypothetical protein